MKRLEQYRLSANTGLLPRLLVILAVLSLMSVATRSETWALQANPTSLTFQAVQGGPNPSSQVVKLYKKSSRQVSWTSKDSATWLSVSPASGTMATAAQVTVSVNASGLAAGTYTGTATVRTSRGSTVSIPVTLRVSAVSSEGTNTAATLVWNPNAETDLAGYKVYVGTSSGLYGSPINVGIATSYVVANLKVGTTYYFTVTAYDQSGNESLRSSEVSKSIY